MFKFRVKDVLKDLCVGMWRRGASSEALCRSPVRRSKSYSFSTLGRISKLAAAHLPLYSTVPAVYAPGSFDPLPRCLSTCDLARLHVLFRSFPMRVVICLYPTSLVTLIS